MADEYKNYSRRKKVTRRVELPFFGYDFLSFMSFWRAQKRTLQLGVLGLLPVPKILQHRW